MVIDFKNIQNKSFVDIPSSSPKITIPIQKVGISNRPTNLKLLNPLNEIECWMQSQLQIGCSLSSNQRGIHMSRIEECMSELKESGLTPLQYATELSGLIKKTQDQTDCFILLDNTIENKVNKNVSGKSSIEIINLHTKIHLSSDAVRIKKGVTVPFMNACPCTQRWGMRDFHNTLSQKGYTKEQIEDLVTNAPLQAHTNGGEASLYIDGENCEHKEIYKVLENSVPIIRELLKGMDEHAFVKMTHQQGQFCEDNIRAIAEVTVKSFNARLSDNTNIKIRVEVNESVHFHNLWAEIEKTFAELKADF